jgi:DNA-binding transcriptional LysR family regulator
VAKYPEVSFELIMTDRMIDLVEEGFDLALRAGPLPDSTLIARRLGLGRKTLCAAPTYLARRGTPKHPADLAGHNCLTYMNSFLENHWRFTGPDGEHEVEVSGNLRTNSIEGMRAAALSGLGICLMPALTIRPDIAAGRLVRLLPEFRTAEAIIQAVYPSSRHLSLKVRTFLDFLVERLACEGVAETVPPAILNGKPAAPAVALRQRSA